MTKVLRDFWEKYSTEPQPRGVQAKKPTQPPPVPPRPPELQPEALKAKFEDRWNKVQGAVTAITKVLSDKKYGDNPRGKLGTAAAKFTQAKDKVDKAVAANNYVAANGELDLLEPAVEEFEQAERERFVEDSKGYYDRWQVIEEKVNQIKNWKQENKLPDLGSDGDAFTDAENKRFNAAFLKRPPDFVAANKALDALEPALQRVETIAAGALKGLRDADREKQLAEQRVRELTSEPEADSDSDETMTEAKEFALRRDRLDRLAAQLDKGLKDKKFAVEFAKPAADYAQAKTKALPKIQDAADKKQYKPQGKTALDELEVAVHTFEQAIQSAVAAKIKGLQGDAQPPLDKKVLGKISDEATRYAKLNATALKGLAPALLDALVEKLGPKAGSADSKALVRAALIARYDMKGLEGDLSTKALPRLYNVMAKVPEKHTRDNPLLQKIRRDKPKEEKASYYKDGYIYLSLQRTGKNTEAFDQDEDVDEAYKIPATEHSRFDAVTLHEIGHSVDDNNKFMDSKGKDATYGGWRVHSKAAEIADLVGQAHGFFTAFPLPRVWLRAYLAQVLGGTDDPSQTLQTKGNFEDVGAAVATREELLADPAIKQAEAYSRQLEQSGWDASLARNARDDCLKFCKLRGPKIGVLRGALDRIFSSNEAERLSVSEAVDATLATLNAPVDVDLTATPPDWAALARHKAVDVCKAIRYQGGKGMWDQGAGAAKTNAIGGRVYQQAYKEKWVSYDLAARKKGVSSYQFRAPAEWFAEVYSAYFLKKLPKAHPLYAWLENECGVPS